MIIIYPPRVDKVSYLCLHSVWTHHLSHKVLLALSHTCKYVPLLGRITDCNSCKCTVLCKCHEQSSLLQNVRWWRHGWRKSTLTCCPGWTSWFYCWWICLRYIWPSCPQTCCWVLVGGRGRLPCKTTKEKVTSAPGGARWTNCSYVTDMTRPSLMYGRFLGQM